MTKRSDRRRRVIFPDPTIWTTQQKEPPTMPTRPATNHELEAGLVALAVLEAQLDGDQDRANFLLDEWRDDLGPIIQYLLLLPYVLLNSFGITDQRPVIAHFRSQLVAKMGEPS